MHDVGHACAVPECRESERASAPKGHALLQRILLARDRNAHQGFLRSLPFRLSLSPL